MSLFPGCNNDVVEPGNELKRNILFYIGGDNNLVSETYQKINQIRAGWEPGRGEMIIYVDQSNKGASLLRINEIKDADGYYGLDTLYSEREDNSADADVLRRVINEMKQDYPADSYGMIFFSHASGWLPKGTLNRPRSLVIDDGDGVKNEMEYDEFASAIPDKQFDFIILEACLMTDAMSMYELRNKAEYVLGSSAEIVSPGFSYIYADRIMSLFDTKRPVNATLEIFGQSYYDCIVSQYNENSAFCSVTMGLINMREMDNLAATTKNALQGADMNETTLKTGDVQRFDRPKKLIVNGYNNSRYFDLAHTVEQIVSESNYRTFNEQLDKTVVWKVATKRFLLGDNNGLPDFNEYDGFFIERHSGLTTYIIQDVYPELNSAFKNSSWYKAIYDN
ncbi:MAG: hypothetical protein LBJ47_11625 [Tannerella sp.]|nr:hypothetical protein [Tannerella sp.]